MREIKEIYVHCSDSYFGTAHIIDSWHRERGWSEGGYNFVILNGQIKSDLYLETLNGNIEALRDMNKVPAHVRGYNTNSIGICLIGKHNFTGDQLNSLLMLLVELCRKYDISYDNVLGHYEKSTKTCPNFNMGKIRHMLKNKEMIFMEEFRSV